MRNLSVSLTAVALLVIGLIVGFIINKNKSDELSPVSLMKISVDNDLVFKRKYNGNSGQPIAQIWSATDTQPQVLVYENPEYSNFIFSEINPDNKQVAFIGEKGDSGIDDLLLLTLNSRETRKIASGSFGSFLWSETESALYYMVDQNEYGLGSIDADANKFILHRYGASSTQDTVIGTYGKLAKVDRTSYPRLVTLNNNQIGIVSSGDDQMFEDRLWKFEGIKLTEIINFHRYPQYHKTRYFGISADGKTTYVLYGMNDAGTDERVGAFSIENETMHDLASIGSGWEVKFSPQNWLAYATIIPQEGSLNSQIMIKQLNLRSNAEPILGASGDEVSIWGWLPDESGLIYRLGSDAYYYSVVTKTSRKVLIPDGAFLPELIGWL